MRAARETAPVPVPVQLTVSVHSSGPKVTATSVSFCSYNDRFARPPRNPHDAHRPLRGDEDLDHVFSWQEERTLSLNLTVHYKRKTYLVERTNENALLAHKRVVVHEWEDGRVELHCEGRQLPYSLFDKNPVVSQGAIVENKRLGAVLTVIQSAQTERDRARLARRHCRRCTERSSTTMFRPLLRAVAACSWTRGAARVCAGRRRTRNDSGVEETRRTGRGLGRRPRPRGRARDFTMRESVLERSRAKFSMCAGITSITCFSS